MEQHVELGGAVVEVELVLDAEVAQAGGHQVVGARDEHLERRDRRVRGEARAGERHEVGHLVGRVDHAIGGEAQDRVGAVEREPAAAAFEEAA